MIQVDGLKSESVGKDVGPETRYEDPVVEQDVDEGIKPPVVAWRCNDPDTSCFSRLHGNWELLACLQARINVR